MMYGPDENYKRKYWQLTNGAGQYLRALQMAPRADATGVHYIVTACECGETPAMFCKSSAAKMLAALLNQHEHRSHKQWKAIEA